MLLRSHGIHALETHSMWLVNFVNALDKSKILYQGNADY